MGADLLFRVPVSLCPFPSFFDIMRDLCGIGPAACATTPRTSWLREDRVGEEPDDLTARSLEELGDHEPPIPADLMHRVYDGYERHKRSMASGAAPSLTTTRSRGLGLP
jgi:hypothetical protein